jgi:hypothetical protein
MFLNVTSERVVLKASYFFVYAFIGDKKELAYHCLSLIQLVTQVYDQVGMAKEDIRWPQGK